MSGQTTLDRLQHWKAHSFDRVGLEYTAELIHNATKELEAAEATIARVEPLVNEWRELAKLRVTTDEKVDEACSTVLFDLAYELKQALEDT